MQILWAEVYKKQYSQLFGSCLQILIFLSKNKQSARNIVKARFAELLLPICKVSMQSNQNDIIGMEIAILGNLTQDKEVKLDEVLDDLIAGGLLPFLQECAPVIPKIKKSEVFLELLIRLVSIQGMVRRWMQKQSILKILVEIMRHGESQMVILRL